MANALALFTQDDLEALTDAGLLASVGLVVETGYCVSCFALTSLGLDGKCLSCGGSNGTD